MFVNNKKGITMVMLVIIIIVMSILVSMVAIQGANATEEAKYAKFLSKVSEVEDAVKIKVMANLVQYVNEDVDYYQWIGVMQGYDVTAANTGTLPIDTFLINDEIITYEVNEEILSKLNYKDDIGKFFVDIQGTVYYNSYTYKNETYYNAQVKYIQDDERFEKFVYKMRVIQNAYDVKIALNAQEYNQIVDPNNPVNVLNWNIADANNYSQQYKYIDILDGYMENVAQYDYVTSTFTPEVERIINSVNVYQFDEEFLEDLGYKKDIDKIFVGEDDVVYHIGLNYDNKVYYNETTFQESIISEKTLQSIAITTPPTKTTYVERETFNPTGMVVKATYSDGTTATISDYIIQHCKHQIQV